MLDESPKSIATSIVDIEGKRITKETDITEALNHLFVAVSPKIAGNIERQTNDNLLR